MDYRTLGVGERGQRTCVWMTYNQGGQLPAGVRRRHGARVAAWG